MVLVEVRTFRSAPAGLKAGGSIPETRPVTRLA